MSAAAFTTCACGVQSARNPCDACFERECSQVRARTPPLVETPAPTCSACGKPAERLPGGICIPCQSARQAVAQAEREAEARARAEELERSLHRCEGGCGEHALRAGVTCSPCRTRQAAEREHRQQVDRALAHLPERYRENTLAAEVTRARVKDPTGLERARAACTAATDWIVFVGPAGVGKTTLAAAAYRRLVELRVWSCSGGFIDARTAALARLQAPLGDEAPIVADVIAADVLLLDDLGIEGEVARSSVPDIIYQRHARAAVTVVTTSLSAEAAAAKYGDGIGRRLFEKRDGAYLVTLRPSKGTR